MLIDEWNDERDKDEDKDKDEGNNRKRNTDDGSKDNGDAKDEDGEGDGDGGEDEAIEADERGIPSPFILPPLLQHSAFRIQNSRNGPTRIRTWDGPVMSRRL
jgi:hypothetical protein